MVGETDPDLNLLNKAVTGDLRTSDRAATRCGEMCADRGRQLPPNANDDVGDEGEATLSRRFTYELLGEGGRVKIQEAITEIKLECSGRFGARFGEILFKCSAGWWCWIGYLGELPCCPGFMK